MIWQADSLHAVVFLDLAAACDALQPWLRVFGTPPQNFQSSSPGMPPSAAASGQIGEYNITILAQPGRLELAFTPAASIDGTPQSIGNLTLAMKAIENYVTKMIAGMRPSRLACVINLSKRADSSHDATASLLADTGLASVPSEATDLQFALNLPKRDTDTGIVTNRLCRWGVGTQQIFTMKISPGSGEPSTAMQEFYASTLTIDVNTGALPLTPSITLDANVLMGLTAEAGKIAEGGYAYLVS